MTFCYDLSRELCTFDFYGWLVQAKAAGATEIVFDARHYLPSIWNAAILRRRFDTIIAPGPALAGLPSREGVEGEKLPIGSSRMGALVRFSRSGSPAPRLASVLPARNAKYTVTLRTQVKSSYRNSNDSAWRLFAAEIGATVIEDYDVAAIDLHERMALYAGAKLNLGIWCGPLTLCTLTEYPVLAFGAGRGKEGIVMDKYGVRHGENMPWCLPNQRVLWDDDDLPTIRKAFRFWKANTGGSYGSE